MFHLSSLVLASSLFLNSAFSTPLRTYYANTTTSCSTASPSRAASDSSCGGCQIVADGAHLLYWNSIISSMVEEDTLHGTDDTSTFASISHAVTVTDSLPVAEATRTLIYPYVDPEYAHPNATHIFPTETVSGFEAYVASKSVNLIVG